MSSTIPSGFTKPVQVRMDQENYHWLKEQAQATERSMNFIFNKVVMDARLAEQHAKQPQGAQA